MLAILLYLAFDHVTYTDASGAYCHAVEIVDMHEFDFCYGRLDRDAHTPAVKGD